MRVVAVASVAVLLVAGCGGPDSGGPSRVVVSKTVAASGRGVISPPHVSPVRSWISLRRTGGLAGVVHVLVVEPDGRWTWTDKTPRRGQLTAAQRAELSRLAAQPALAVEASLTPGPPKCADGFLYTLTVDALTVVWGDCGAASPPNAVAITELLAAATPL